MNCSNYIYDEYYEIPHFALVFLWRCSEIVKKQAKRCPSEFGPALAYMSRVLAGEVPLGAASIWAHSPGVGAFHLQVGGEGDTEKVRFFMRDDEETDLSQPQHHEDLFLWREDGTLRRPRTAGFPRALELLNRIMGEGNVYAASADHLTNWGRMEICPEQTLSRRPKQSPIGKFNEAWTANATRWGLD